MFREKKESYKNLTAQKRGLTASGAQIYYLWGDTDRLALKGTKKLEIWRFEPSGASRPTLIGIGEPGSKSLLHNSHFPSFLCLPADL